MVRRALQHIERVVCDRIEWWPGGQYPSEELADRALRWLAKIGLTTLRDAQEATGLAVQATARDYAKVIGDLRRELEEARALIQALREPYEGSARESAIERAKGVPRPGVHVRRSGR